MTHEKAHPPAAPAAPSAASGAREEGSVRPTRSTEINALENIVGHHAQIMDLLGRDPDGADDLAWENAAEILSLSIHDVLTVIRQRRHRATMKPVTDYAKDRGFTNDQVCALAMGMPVRRLA